jgi:hypothetical protein
MYELHSTYWSSDKGPTINYVVLVEQGGREVAPKTIYYLDLT